MAGASSVQDRKRLRRLFLAIQPFTALRVSPLNPINRRDVLYSLLQQFCVMPAL
jgi:hypothetical protein